MKQRAFTGGSGAGKRVAKGRTTARVATARPRPTTANTTANR